MLDNQTKSELKSGNPFVFKEVFSMLYPRMKGYCMLFFNDVNRADDIIQETFLALWENREFIQKDKSLESYMFVILRNKCLNYLKRKRLENENVDLENISISELQYLYQLDFTRKEEKSLEEQLIESLKVAIDELPDKMKTVFTLCKIEGRNQKEVAKELGISIKMVEKHISKAKQQIRQKLNHQFPALLIIVGMLLQ